MPKSILSTLVFVGREFDTSMFDERDLRDTLGPLDGNQIKAGPLGQFSYARGTYGFSVTPDRVDIRHSGRDILPPPLLTAGEIVAEQLEPVRGFISAVGINCDAVFYSQEIGKEGKVFCQDLTETDLFRRVYNDHTNVATLSVASAFPGHIIQQYNVRIEPEGSSQGRDLFVAFNGHQGVVFTDSLKEKLVAIEEVRSQVERFHQQILASRG